MKLIHSMALYLFQLNTKHYVDNIQPWIKHKTLHLTNTILLSLHTYQHINHCCLVVNLEDSQISHTGLWQHWIWSPLDIVLDCNGMSLQCCNNHILTRSCLCQGHIHPDLKIEIIIPTFSFTFTLSYNIRNYVSLQFQLDHAGQAIHRPGFDSQKHLNKFLKNNKMVH